MGVVFKNFREGGGSPHEIIFRKYVFLELVINRGSGILIKNWSSCNPGPQTGNPGPDGTRLALSLWFQGFWVIGSKDISGSRVPGF